MTLWILILLIIGIGALLALVEKAPFVSDAVKPILRWLAVAIIVIMILDFVGIIALMKSYSVRR